jgi:hypothetical protein
MKKMIVVDVLIAQLPKHSAALTRVWRCGGWRIDRVDGAPRPEQPRSSPRGSARARDRRSRSSPDEMTLATATGSAPRPRTIARPPPARRRPTRRARRERPVRGSARASGRRSSRCRTAGPAPLRVRDSPPSSPRRPGPHRTTSFGRFQGELSVLFCARFPAHFTQATKKSHVLCPVAAFDARIALTHMGRRNPVGGRPVAIDVDRLAYARLYVGQRATAFGPWPGACRRRKRAARS